VVDVVGSTTPDSYHLLTSLRARGVVLKRSGGTPVTRLITKIYSHIKYYSAVLKLSYTAFQ